MLSSFLKSSSNRFFGECRFQSKIDKNWGEVSKKFKTPKNGDNPLFNRSVRYSIGTVRPPAYESLSESLTLLPLPSKAILLEIILKNRGLYYLLNSVWEMLAKSREIGISQIFPPIPSPSIALLIGLAPIPLWGFMK